MISDTHRPPTRDLDFYLDVVATGTVLSADPTSDPETVTGILGAAFAENRLNNALWRDYGLVEFFWHRHTGQHEWQATHFTVQAHRLANQGGEVVNTAIRSRYGDFGAAPRFAALRAALAQRGVALVEIPAVSPDCREFWQPDSQVCVLVVNDPSPYSNTTTLNTGEVYAITAPLAAETVATRHQDARQAQSIKDGLRHLVRASEPERLRWLARRQPADGTVNWWLHLFLRVEHRVYDRQDGWRDWARLHLWLIGQAERAGAFDHAETAIRVAMFAARLHNVGAAEEIADMLPSADYIVRACLDSIPITFDQAGVPVELGDDNLEAMRRSRQARHQISAAAHHLDRVRDQALAEELRRWIALQPKLV